jgi:iron-sulfur cluster repair protein YtfE (RIC family)
MARCESCNEWVDCDKCCDLEEENRRLDQEGLHLLHAANEVGQKLEKLEEELQDIKQRSIHSDWETATREQLIDCLKFTATVRDAYGERNEKLVLENRELKKELEPSKGTPLRKKK